MATRKQKEDLVRVLKFKPRDITISLSGYGGEIVMGRITEQQYDFWRDRDDLSDFVYDWDGEIDVPADMRFVTDGAWHDVDDICHESGCEASDCSSISVYDEHECKDIWESNLDIQNLESKGVNVDNHWHCCPSEDQDIGTCVFLGQSFEKGTFFSGTIRITEPFDHRKLSISWNDCDGWRLISSVEYDGEEVEGYDAYSTTGKGMEFRVFCVESDDADLQAAADALNEVFADELANTQKTPSELMSWDPAAELEKIAVPDINDFEPEYWEGIEITPWYTMDDEPVHKGEYQVMVGTWPFPNRAEWTGRKWKAISTTADDIKTLTHWRGLTRRAD